MPSFVCSAVKEADYPFHLVGECCIVGRSNSGKSTLVNALARTNISKTSKKPGKTKTLNFFDFGFFYLVDMPGYGFASTSHRKLKGFEKMCSKYLMNRDCVSGIIHLCSISEFTEFDLEMLQYLSSKFDNYCLILNKVDKFSKAFQLKRSQEVLSITKLSKQKLLLISAKKETNLKDLFAKIKQWVN